jgi:hypothetical protein
MLEKVEESRRYAWGRGDSAAHYWRPTGHVYQHAFISYTAEQRIKVNHSKDGRKLGLMIGPVFSAGWPVPFFLGESR